MTAVPETLDTDRLVLRRPSAADAPAIYEYARDPDVTRYLTFPTHRSLADATAFLTTCAARWDSGQEYCWLITVRDDVRAVGVIAARMSGHRADIGYALARHAWRHGYATEAGRAVVGWLATRTDIHRVWAVCDVDNAASAHVLEKLGMAREGILHRWIVHPNVSPIPRDCYVYALTRAWVA